MTPAATTPDATENSAGLTTGTGTGPITVGAAVAGLTLVVYQWVVFAGGIPLRMFFPIAALFVAQSVFNGVVLAYCFGERRPLEMIGANAGRQAALRQVSVVLVGALFAVGGILPLAFAKFGSEKVTEPAAVLAAGSLLAAVVLGIVVAPPLYALAVRPGTERR